MNLLKLYVRRGESAGTNFSIPHTSRTHTSVARKSPLNAFDRACAPGRQSSYIGLGSRGGDGQVRQRRCELNFHRWTAR